MRTEEEIIDMMQTLKVRQNFFEYQEQKEGISKHIYPDPIDDAACKILTIKWVLGVIDDLFVYPDTRTKYNQELLCLNILQEIKEEEKQKKEIKDILKGKGIDEELG